MTKLVLLLIGKYNKYDTDSDTDMDTDTDTDTDHE